MYTNIVLALWWFKKEDTIEIDPLRFGVAADNFLYKYQGEKIKWIFQQPKLTYK